MSALTNSAPWKLSRGDKAKGRSCPAGNEAHVNTTYLAIGGSAARHHPPSPSSRVVLASTRDSSLRCAYQQRWRFGISFPTRHKARKFLKNRLPGTTGMGRKPEATKESRDRPAQYLINTCTASGSTPTTPEAASTTRAVSISLIPSLLTITVALPSR